jgi:hypothetical protein
VVRNLVAVLSLSLIVQRGRVSPDQVLLKSVIFGKDAGKLLGNTRSDETATYWIAKTTILAQEAIGGTPDEGSDLIDCIGATNWSTRRLIHVSCMIKDELFV